MKKNLLFIQTLLVCLCLSLTAYAQNSCENFNGGVGTWQASNAAISTSTTTPRADGTRYLKGDDGTSGPGTGGSWLFSTSYNAEAITCGADLCYDYKVFNDGVNNSSPQMTSQIRIYQGTVGNQTLSATFVLNNPITENSAWLNVCAPIYPITGNQLPSNAQGQWVMSNPANWNTLIANFDGVAFNTDVAGSSFQTEDIGIDNFCLTNNGALNPVPAFHFEDANGNFKTTFTCNEDVFMDGTASQNELRYFIDIWRRPIGSTGAFGYGSGLGWTLTPFNNTLNLTQLFAQNGYTLEEGFEYEVKLAVGNDCDGWEDITHRFTMQPVSMNSDFTYSMRCEANGTISVTVTAVDPNPSQGWNLYETTTAGATSDAQTITQVGNSQGGTTTTFTGLSRNKFYYIKHGVWNNCSPWQETRKALPTGDVVWQGMTSNFDISASSDFSGNVTVNTLAHGTNGVFVYHWWGIFTDAATLNQVPGNAIQCCNNNGATFSANLQINVWYYIKHGIWNDCVGWKETRKAIRIQQSLKSPEGPLTVEIREVEEVTKASIDEMKGRVQSGNLMQADLDKYLQEETLEVKNKVEVKRVNTGDQLIISPNPIQKGSVLQIKTVDEASIQKVELFDSQGNVKGVYHFTEASRAEIQPRNLKANELYLIRVVTTTGEILTGRVLMN
ncbi:MAG: hypothetical protein ACPGJS_13495 [Flammeovirgaceae bacterium]